MSTHGQSTLDFVKLFSRSIKSLIGNSTGISLHVAKSAIRISGIQMLGDISTFVAFKGDYSGIMILNFEGNAALELVGGYLTTLGLGEEDIPKHFANDDVRNNIGEMTNQLIGRCRTSVEEAYDLSAKANIPAVVPITVPIALGMMTTEANRLDCVRVSFTTPKRNRFYMELGLEPMSAMKLDID
jgi:CheY-specific phosphatase CheX